ncbi:hypothetical protein BKA62DRAFT_695543 [Auriculariales sp. MPI-PUGE-AT-0066]|nr:hypothetical protein BKA62DRAFT_695543 [Auriculariales sp. MPI-PUGE-AT-0066]
MSEHAASNRALTPNHHTRNRLLPTMTTAIFDFDWNLLKTYYTEFEQSTPLARLRWLKLLAWWASSSEPCVLRGLLYLSDTKFFTLFTLDVVNCNDENIRWYFMSCVLQRAVGTQVRTAQTDVASRLRLTTTTHADKCPPEHITAGRPVNFVLQLPLEHGECSIFGMDQVLTMEQSQ